jgi:ParB family protein of integrating conjugative element (PFGI_1 class)
MTAPKNPRPLGLPITVSAAEVVANIAKANEMDRSRGRRISKIAESNLQPAGGLPFGQAVADARPPTKAAIDQEKFKASYLVSDTTPSKVDLSNPDIPGYIRLEVTAIDSYDHNPRQWKNEKYEEIYSSIKEGGFTGSLTVTRRHPGARYMLAAGSNTTLQILQDLWAETADEKYRWVDCIFQPYDSETRLLAQHLGENLNRGDMRFWEVAKGMCDLLGWIEAESRTHAPEAKELSIRDKVEALAARGLKVQKSAIQLWLFAVQRLQKLGVATTQLSYNIARDTIQPRLGALKNLAAKFKIQEEEYWATVVDPVLAAYAKDIDASTSYTFEGSALCDLVESALAEKVGESVAVIRQMLSVLKLSPELTLADLRMPSPSLLAGPASQSAGLDAPAPAASTRTATPTQSPLALGPGQVRGAGAHPPAAPTNHRASLNTPASAALPDPHAHPVPTATGPLFAQAEPGGDPLQEFHAALRRLLEITNLTDTLRLRDEMPLGFYLELPDREIHARRKVAMGSPEFHARDVKSVTWWSLVFLSGQYREGSVPYIDHASQFFQHFSTDSGPNPLDGTDIQNDLPDVQDVLAHHIGPGPMRAAMQQMRVVEECAARVLEALPERWKLMNEISRMRY